MPQQGRFKFDWKDRSTWPPEGKDYVFLGDAVLQMGAKLWPENWNDNDIKATPLFLPDIPLAKASGPQLAVARILLRETRHDISSPEHFTEEIWNEALIASRQQMLVHLEAEGRAKAAKEMIRKFSVQEALLTAIRWERDGSYSPLQSTLWTLLPKVQEWFQTCQVASTDIFSGASHGQYHWIYVSKRHLENIPIAGAASSSPSVAEPAKGHRSDYLQFLLAAADALNVTPDDERLAKQVEADVLAYARNTGAARIITQTMAEKMASILRGSDAGAGKASIRYKKK
ncbi:MAG: hypothetical protein EOQ93_32150 [Mesorhizobium sp.]|uniref:hypothetical protein n=1 Tax=Mesorhizobium sp. TaxID=1871066 RepID=UPI000FE788D8|nr:hypothetical protein [Mesorhizobium sp.]RWI40023.1 MAG: hypothetical protein EOQ93_32150 [Mesorhizobium sp.]RWM92005.1 MAG: hypothetical protein EOR86_23220 [Mesorhizobium sp.]